MAKPTKPASNSTATTIDEVLQRGIEGIDLFISDALEMLQANPSNSDLASTLATVTVKVASVAAEQRKAEAAARKAEEDMSPERILDRIRRMSARDQKQLLQQVNAVVGEQGRSGLA